MASISKASKTGSRYLQFVDPVTKKRRTLHLSQMTKREADGFKYKLERLVSCKQAGVGYESDVATWVASLDKGIADKLAEWGLIQPRADAFSPPLASFLDGYFAKRTDVKPGTQIIYRRVRNHLVTFFGANRQLKTITAGEADDWTRFLQQQGLGRNTVRRHIGFARQFFRVAIRHKLITENPFAELKAAMSGNPDRYYFLTADDTYKLMDACNSTEWRLIIALARFGGLRTPSETFALQWQHVNWETNRITVPSPKTEHHAGHASRLVPIFPELRPYLQAAWDQAEPGAVHLITSYRDTKQNLRTQFERIIQRAGLKPWPKLFQNLRSSRETELLEKFPIQSVTAWIGNSEAVAKKHYLQVTDAHFDRASSEPCSALHPALRYTSICPDSRSQAESQNSAITNAIGSIPVYTAQQVDVAGPEPCDGKNSPASTLRQSVDSCAASGAAFPGNSAKLAAICHGAADLAELIAAWPELPPNVRADVLKLVRTARPHAEVAGNPR